MEVNSLSKFAVRGQWDNIVQAYENNPMSREAKLTNLETQLYTLQQQLGKPILYIRLGGNHGRKYIKRVLRIRFVLRIQNAKGNAALHDFIWLQLLGMKQCATARPQKIANSSLFATMTVRLHSFWQPFMAIWMHFFASVLLTKQKITVSAEKIMGRPFFILPYLENTLVCYLTL